MYQLRSACNGKLKDVPIHIKVDESVSPACQPHRHISFNICKQVEQELEKLEEADMIKETVGPTPVASLLVSIPKPWNPNDIW